MLCFRSISTNSCIKSMAVLFTDEELEQKYYVKTVLYISRRVLNPVVAVKEALKEIVITRVQNLHKTHHFVSSGSLKKQIVPTSDFCHL